MEQKKQRIFVYGTLKKGQYFHERYLGGTNSNFLGSGTASRDFTLYVGAAPHLIREPTDTPVKGELYEVDNDVLASIDYLEAHPVVYKREIIEVFTSEGEKVLAWAYLRHKNFKDKPYCFKEVEFI